MSDKSESDRDRENGSGSPPISGSPGESGSPSASLQHVHHGNFNHGASSSSSDVNSEIGYPVAEHDIAEKTPSPVEAKYIPDLEVELALRIRGIEIGVPLMTPKIAHGLYQPGIDKECMIKTNLFGLKVKNGVIFQYHIEFKKPKDAIIFLIAIDNFMEL
uniref:Uncharacterized protein n=1 Tax=Panagrolaimus superbus TaxID=310955 RepID=A0A914YUR8_9BILA